MRKARFWNKFHWVCSWPKESTCIQMKNLGQNNLLYNQLLITCHIKKTVPNRGLISCYIGVTGTAEENWLTKNFIDPHLN